MSVDLGVGYNPSQQETMNKVTNFAVSGFQVGGYGYTNITTSAQTLVKSGPGILGKIALQSTLISAIKAYDNTVSGGNVVAYIPGATSAGTVFEYNCRFTTGLVVSSGGGADTFNVEFN